VGVIFAEKSQLHFPPTNPKNLKSFVLPPAPLFAFLPSFLARMSRVGDAYQAVGITSLAEFNKTPKPKTCKYVLVFSSFGDKMKYIAYPRLCAPDFEYLFLSTMTLF
jgi:hypothetical protein